jgi:hypothetical protein
MRLVKVTCELKYAERVKVLARYEDLYADLLKKAPEGVERWVIPGLRLEDKDKKRVMLVDPVRSVIDIEQPPNVGFCMDLIMQFFKSVEERLGIPQIARYGLRSTWIEEFKGSFEDLLGKCKGTLFAPCDLISKASDVCAIFDHDIKEGKRIHTTTGPMKVTQLKEQFLVYDPESIPTLFLYVDADMGDTSKRQYSAQYLHEFVDEAIKLGEMRASEVISLAGFTK